MLNSIIRIPTHYIGLAADGCLIDGFVGIAVTGFFRAIMGCTHRHLQALTQRMVRLAGGTGGDRPLEPTMGIGYRLRHQDFHWRFNRLQPQQG